MNRLIALVLVLFLSFESFGAQVSDNDGAAFITKAEFDSMKNTFQAEINDYNNGLDSKIDAAINEYVTGAKSASESQKSTLVEYAKNNYIYAYDKNDPLDYVYGWPIFWGDFSTIRYTNSGSANREVGALVSFSKGGSTTDNQQKKTVITSLTQDTSDAWFASWYGYCEKAIDTLYFTINDFGVSDGQNEAAPTYAELIATGQLGTGSSGIKVVKNSSLIGTSLWGLRSCRDGYSALPSGTATFGRSDGVKYIITPFCSDAVLRGIEHDWGERNQDEIVINKTYDYDMFSNYNRDYNFGYVGDYKTEFISGFAKENKDVWTNPGTGGLYQKSDNPDILQYCVSGSVSSSLYATEWSDATTRSSTVARSNWATLGNYTNVNVKNNGTFYFPLVGFETTYLTNWKQIVSPNTASIATKEYNINNTTTGIVEGKDGTKYLSVCAGLPVADLEVGQQLSKLTVSFAETGNHIVWFSNRPFDPTKDPQSNSNLIGNMTGGAYNSTYKGYIVSNQKVDFRYMRTDYSKEEIIYMKWAKFTSPSTIKANSGVKLGSTYVILQN